MTLDAFGSNLRRIRLQRGISLAQIAESTKIAEDLLEGLERNDFSQWPTGLFARSFIREYASAIGADAELSVDEFCRHFPQADRRAEPLIRDLADSVGHRLVWRDDDEPQRRLTDSRSAAKPQRPGVRAWLFARLTRLLLAHR
jgi:transcriptional regulator with XRE-family HTH domain